MVNIAWEISAYFHLHMNRNLIYFYCGPNLKSRFSQNSKNALNMFVHQALDMYMYIYWLKVKQTDISSFANSFANITNVYI